MYADKVGHLSIHFLIVEKLEGRIVVRRFRWAARLLLEILQVDMPVAHAASSIAFATLVESNNLLILLPLILMLSILVRLVLLLLQTTDLTKLLFI